MQLAPFRDAKRLFDAVIKEVKAAKLDPKQELDVNFIKDMLFSVVASESVEAAIWPCLAHSIYEKHRITTDSFESLEGREDFLEICYEVGKENILPFGKNLYAELSPLLGNLALSQK